MYEYRASIIEWIDGDTVALDLDLGFNIHVRQHCRLLGVDTPERGEPNYNEARLLSESIYPAGSQIVVTTEKPLAGDKYGRYLIPLPAVSGALKAAGIVKPGSKYNFPVPGEA